MARDPRTGLYTGIAVFGAIGSEKTSCCMYPYAEQILGFRANDPDGRPGGLVLEVKGDFCHKVKDLVHRYRRGEDYLEVSLESEFRYNPLHNDLDAYPLAYGIASLLNNLFGKGKEPFWQQAYTNLVNSLFCFTRLCSTTSPCLTFTSVQLLRRCSGICYEQVLVLPVLLSAIDHPTLIVGMANQYWVRETSIPAAQRASLVTYSKR